MDYIRSNENYNNSSCLSGNSLGHCFDPSLSFFQKSKLPIYIIYVIIKIRAPKPKQVVDSLQLSYIEKQDPNSGLCLHSCSNRGAMHQTHKHREE